MAKPRRGTVENREVNYQLGRTPVTSTWPMIWSGSEWLRLDSEAGRDLFQEMEDAKMADHGAEAKRVLDQG